MISFELNIQNIYGMEGKAWLNKLPNRITEIALNFDLHELTPASNLNYHYVLTGYQQNRPIILKLGFDIESLKKEARALLAFSGYGVANLLAEEEGMLLLQRAIPGISLKNYFPNRHLQSIEIACQVIRKLHQANIPTRDSLSHIKDWLSVIDKHLDIPIFYLQKARRLRDRLFVTSSSDVLLHGDLHHDNILQHGNDWMVIDPKGAIGEPAYEVAAFIRNPLPELLNHDNSQKIIRNRIKGFAEILELSPQRIFDWCFVQSVLTWNWALEDHGDVEYWEKITKIFDESNLF